MGVRAEALTDHRVPDFRDHDAVLSLLVPTVPDLLAVEDYWRINDPDHVKRTTTAWRVDHRHSHTPGEFLRYYSPGDFSIAFGKKVAAIGGPGRWSGFCTMPMLQSVHIPAFRAIARALGGTKMALHADDEDRIYEAAIYDGSSLDECITMLQNELGPAQPTITIVTEDVQEYYRRPHRPWFLEPLTPSL